MYGEHKAAGISDSGGAGIIPACTGSTLPSRSAQPFGGDHPRMYGEHEHATGVISWFEGSSPHVRGALYGMTDAPVGVGIIPACTGSTVVGSPLLPPLLGSSPHVRGARTSPWNHRLQLGIIPACTGSTHTVLEQRDGDGDHPRMYGEHHIRDDFEETWKGSSPHVRGAHDVELAVVDERGIIPACTGSTSQCLRPFGRRWDHPRMYGEHTIVLLEERSI